MRYLVILVILLSEVSHAQRTEFPIYDNGLIYDDPTMQRLRSIVDSMNLRFKNCEPQTYRSHFQGRATLVRVPSKALRTDLKNGLPWEKFVSENKNLIVRRNVWIIKETYEDWDGQRKVMYTELPSAREESITVDDIPEHHKTSGWIVGDEEKMAWYIHELKANVIPSRYGRLVQYVDCMIDTTAHIFIGKEDDTSSYGLSTGQVHEFLIMKNFFPEPPQPPKQRREKTRTYDAEYTKYWKDYITWDSLRRLQLQSCLRNDPEYRDRLRAVIEVAIDEQTSTDELEEYVAEFISKEDALTLKRSRRVVGGCSMDESPRYHAMNICVLAAQTAQWDIFLRSHLDIMNDRMHRVSDGSWAWQGRQTYLRELEQLDINAVDLLLGTALRVQGVSDNHYFSSISRIGRALAETSNPEQLESRLTAMILDEELDTYNRLLAAYLFRSYVYNAPDKRRLASLQKHLQEVMAKAPEVIRDPWKKTLR